MKIIRGTFKCSVKINAEVRSQCETVIVLNVKFHVQFNVSLKENAVHAHAVFS